MSINFTRNYGETREEWIARVMVETRDIIEAIPDLQRVPPPTCPACGTECRAFHGRDGKPKVFHPRYPTSCKYAWRIFEKTKP